MSRSIHKVAGRDRLARRVAAARGLTLVEVLLTMSLLVVLAALIVPAMTRPLARQRLSSAADQVRADWIRARTKAISSGQTYVFRYLPESDRYSMQPAASGDAMVEEASTGGATLDLSTTSQETSSTIERVLPEGITFQSDSSDQQDLTSLTASAGDFGDFGGGATFDSVGTLAEIRFAPDGTTSTARVTLKNRYGRSIELRLRGLTGVITVGEVQAAEETPADLQTPSDQATSAGQETQLP